MLKQLLLVGIGGSLGSMLRYLVSVLTGRFVQSAFPLPTLLVNLTGCFLIGLLAGALSHVMDGNTNLRLLLITGFCGGYTTFSAFAYENLQLIESQQFTLAIAYTLLSVVLGIGLVWTGMLMTA